MDAERQATIKGWLLACRGTTTQETLARDIQAVTGWTITRDRYSKYEGPLPVGQQTLDHFIEYWRAKGKPGPDFGARPSTEPTPDDPTLAAAIQALVGELQLWRKEREADRLRLEKLEAVVASLVAGALDPAGTPPSATPRALPETKE